MYGSGQFLIDTETNETRLYPQSYYQLNGDVVSTNTVLGKVYVIIHPIDDLLASSAVSTKHLHEKEEIYLSDRHNNEKETIFLAEIPGKYIKTIEVP
jgi:hypothetical protein